MNWGPGAQGGFQNALAMGLQFGQMTREAQDRRQERNALSAYVKDPNEANFGGLADVRPDIAIGERRRMEEQKAAARKQQMEQMGTFRQLLDQAGSNPQQAYMAAQQLGIDVSEIPQPGSPDFEPWRQQQLFIMRALETKEGQDLLTNAAKEAMLRLPPDQRDVNNPAFIAEMQRVFESAAFKAIPVQPGGSVVGYNTATGESRPIVQPGYGSQSGGQPVSRQVGGQTYWQGQDGQWYDNEREAMGGSGGNAAGGFPGN